MAVTAAMVKELRERTGLGMMDCKVALTEAGGDMELAIEELRKRYDAGDKLGFLQATVEYALKRDGLGANFRDYLKSLEL